MFRCGIDYCRCRWIVPLLLLFAVIFDIIAVAAKSGWIEDETGEKHYSNMWEHCRGNSCKPLTEYAWGKAVAALMIIGVIILTLVFILSIYAMCKLNTGFFPTLAGLLVLVVILQVIALIIYPIKFNDFIYEGNYYYTWAYGFGWGATILSLGCSILHCILPTYEEKMEDSRKIDYFYTMN